MGLGLAANRHPTGRTLLPLVAGVAILLLLGPIGITGSSHGPEKAPGGLPAHPSGAGAVADAQSSLALGRGPAASHPTAIPSSPGGYVWRNASAAVGIAPTGRLTVMAWDPLDGYVLLFGWANFGGNLRDTWTFANGTWSNISGLVGTTPPRATDGAMAYDPSSHELVLYEPLFNATWTYHDRSWVNITATAGVPTETALASFVTDSSDNEAILFGGEPAWGPTIYNHQTWAFKNGTWRDITSTAPFNFGRILLPDGADDPTDHGVVAAGLSEFDNNTPTVIHPATFLFSNGAWTNLTPTLPTEPDMGEGPVIDWLPSIGADVMENSFVINSTGGIGYGVGVTWEFSHGVWSNVTTLTGLQPDNGLFGSGAVDPIDNTMVMFGGERVVGVTPFYPATWIFSAAPTVGASASKPVVDAGQSVTFTGTVANGVAPYAPRWSFGDGSNGTALSGSHTYSKAGLITATLTVTDLVGHSVSATASVYVNAAPTVSASAAPAGAANGTWIAFASSVSGGTAPFTYGWTLGDGSTSSAASFAHAYAKKGNYTVNLTVTDAVGVVKSATFTVAVTPPAAPTSPPSSSSSSSVSLTSGTGLYLILALLGLLVVAVILGVLLARRPKSPPGTLQPYPPASGPVPPAGASPPSGAGGPP